MAATTCSRSWVFTLNNYTEVDEQKLKDLEYKCLVFGREIAPETGTPHLQGFIIFCRGYRFNAVKKLLGANAHIEKAKTNDAANYCMKEGDYFKDDRRCQGARSDLTAVYKMVADKQSLLAVAEAHPSDFLRYHAGIEKLRRIFHNTPRNPDEPPTITWIHGPTGIGKTRRVVAAEKDLWTSGKNLRWWNGYEQQAAVLIDDFRGDFCTFHELLRILDRYPYTVEVKNGYVELNSPRIYITSCFPPDRVYETREDIGQLLRRITSTIYMETPVTE